MKTRRRRAELHVGDQRYGCDPKHGGIRRPGKRRNLAANNKYPRRSVQRPHHATYHRPRQHPRECRQRPVLSAPGEALMTLSAADQRLAWAVAACRNSQMRLTPLRQAMLAFLATQRMPVSLEMIAQADGVRGQWDTTPV